MTHRTENLKNFKAENVVVGFTILFLVGAIIFGMYYSAKNFQPPKIEPVELNINWVKIVFYSAIAMTTAATTFTIFLVLNVVGHHTNKLLEKVGKG